MKVYLVEDCGNSPGRIYAVLANEDDAQRFADAINGALDTQAQQIDAAKALVAFKKAAKKGWDKLGITEKEAARVLDIANGKSDLKAEAPKAKPAPAKQSPDWAPSRIVNGVETGTGTPRERIRKLLDNGLTSVGVAQAIVEIKKKAKKSWEALGVSATELEQVLKLAGK